MCVCVFCSGVLVQPQWKHFRHFDMLKNDQIRLSNGIWRSWHIKCMFTSTKSYILNCRYINRGVCLMNHYRREGEGGSVGGNSGL